MAASDLMVSSPYNCSAGCRTWAGQRLRRVSRQRLPCSYGTASGYKNLPRPPPSLLLASEII